MTRNSLRYDWYGALIGLGLPLVGTVIESVRQLQSATAADLLGALAPAALLRAHLGQPLLWIMDTTPIVLGLLGRAIVVKQEMVVRQSEELVEKSQALVAAEQARREGFEATARKLFHAAQGLLGTVSDFTSTTGEAAASVRRVTEALSGVSQAASAAALTADTVIGIGVQAERASADALHHVEAAGAEMLRLAEEVREFASAVEGLSRPLAALREQSTAVRDLARAAERLVDLVVKADEAGGGAELVELDRALREHASEMRRTAVGLDRLLAEVQEVKEAAMRAAQAGGERAGASARVASRTGETIRELAVSLRDSARAAREIARVAQQQEGDIEQVLKAMNEIALATAGTVVSTQHVESEARALNDLAASLRDEVKGE
jgi:methyl-accepting chemotaxis protein